MTYAQYLRQLLAPLGIYQLNAPFQGGELEALGEAFDQVEGALLLWEGVRVPIQDIRSVGIDGLSQA